MNTSKNYETQFNNPLMKEEYKKYTTYLMVIMIQKSGELCEKIDQCIESFQLRVI